MIISSINYKGGVGKSTVAQNLAVSLVHQGYKVCVVDADNTRATSSWSDRRDENSIEPSIPCISLTNPKSFAKQVRAQYEQYDVLIIDCPPALSPIAVKAMYTSHFLVIPISTTGGSDVWVSEQLLEKFQEIREAKEDAGDDPVNAQLLVNMHRSNVTLHTLAANIVEQLSETYEVGMFKVKLGNRVAYGEANVSGLGVVEYSDRKAKVEIDRLTRELVALATA
ncbi:MAG: AAA family ATPase [Lewinella sp.]